MRPSRGGRRRQASITVEPRGAIWTGLHPALLQSAGIGRLVHAIRARRQMEEQQDAQTKAQQQRQAQFQKYDRAFGACLTGRGDTIQ
jgi:hypothetical protein